METRSRRQLPAFFWMFSGRRNDDAGTGRGPPVHRRSNLISGSFAGVRCETPEQGVKPLQRGGGLKRLAPDPLQDVALKHRDDRSRDDGGIDLLADQSEALGALQQPDDLRNRLVNAARDLTVHLLVAQGFRPELQADPAGEEPAL